MLLLPDEGAYCGARLYEMGNINQMDMTRAWQIFSTTLLDFRAFTVWKILILTSCLKKPKMGYIVHSFLVYALPKPHPFMIMLDASSLSLRKAPL